MEEKEIKNSIENTPLTEGEVLDVLKFAGAYYSGYSASRYELGAFTPSLTNERLSQIGLTPQKANKQTLEQQFLNPDMNSENLVGYSEYIQLTESAAKRTMLYMGNLPSFDWTMTCVNIDDDREYNSPEYKADYKKVKEFIAREKVESSSNLTQTQFRIFRPTECCSESDMYTRSFWLGI